MKKKHWSERKGTMPVLDYEDPVLVRVECECHEEGEIVEVPSAPRKENFLTLKRVASMLNNKTYKSDKHKQFLLRMYENWI